MILLSSALRHTIDIAARACRKLAYLGASVVARVRLRQYNVTYGKGLVVYGSPIVSVVDGSSLELGDRVVLCSWSAYTALGVPHAVILRTLQPGARIVIGNDVGVSGASICAATSVEVGHRTLLGANVIITDTDFHPVHPTGRRYAAASEASSSKVVIEEDVFIGANAIVLKGVRVGRGSVIGAGSVVVNNIPAGVIAAGNPCRVIRNLVEPSDTEHRP